MINFFIVGMRPPMGAMGMGGPAVGMMMGPVRPMQPMVLQPR